MTMLDLDPFEFDQTGKGWRSLKEPTQQILVIKEYLDKNQNTDDNMIQSIHFHLGQALAMRNLDENDILYAIHHMKQSLSESDSEWNDYVNATIAFLQKDKEELEKYVGKQNYNDGVIYRLYENFDKEYKDAY